MESSVFQLRDSLIDHIKTRAGKWLRAWIIGVYPLQTEHQRLATVLGAELIYVDATEDERIRRFLHGTDKLPFQKEWQKYIYD